MTESTPERLREVVLQQIKALFRQVTNPRGNTAYIGVQSAQLLEKRCRFFGGRIESLPRAERSRALVYIDSQGAPELWCRPMEKGGPGGSHYETDWNRFTRHHFNLDFGQAETSMLNIDHLYPETTAKHQGMSHVRVTAINGAANQNLGRTIEKLMANRTPRRKVIHLASELTLAKVSGCTVPITKPTQAGQPVDAAAIAQTIRHFVDLGLTENDPTMIALTEHLTRWTVTRLQGGDADLLGPFIPPDSALDIDPD